MPGGGNPKRAVRVPDDLWADYERACLEAGVKPEDMHLKLILWWARTPGVTLPPRPKLPRATE